MSQPSKPKRPTGEAREIQRLGRQLDRAAQARRRAEEERSELKRRYEEQKRLHPEFWKAIGFPTEQQFLNHFDLVDFLK